MGVNSWKTLSAVIDAAKKMQLFTRQTLFYTSKVLQIKKWEPFFNRVCINVWE